MVIFQRKHLDFQHNDKLIGLFYPYNRDWKCCHQREYVHHLVHTYGKDMRERREPSCNLEVTLDSTSNFLYSDKLGDC